MKTKFITIILAQFFCATFLFAQTPTTPTTPLTPATPAQPDNATVKFPEASQYANTNLSYTIIDAPNNTFGYDIYSSGKLTIHQTSKPGLPGNEGFKTKDDAIKVAEMVMYKIRKGEMPPTVTVEEMKELGVIK